MAAGSRRMLAVTASVLLVLVLTTAALADPLTQAEAQALFPDYNITEQNGFPDPCVDANGTITLVMDLGPITQGDISVAMVCEAPATYPPFCVVGPVSFEPPDHAFLLQFFEVPGHPAAFALEYVVYAHTGPLNLIIDNTCWPEGCVVGMLDFAGWKDWIVPVLPTTWGRIKATF